MSTLLGGELPVHVINNNTYVPVLRDNHVRDTINEESEISVENAIWSALSEAKTVVVGGSEGSGKSTTLEKLFSDWSKGEQLQQFTHVFYFRFSEINLLEEPTTFKAFLQHSRHPPVGPIAQPEDVLFIFDELDQYRHTLDPSVYSLCPDQDQTAPVSCLVASLVHGALMPGARCLLASRTTPNLGFLNGIQVDILGFLKQQREDFVNKFFTHTAVANNVLQHFERTLGFYDFSRSPKFCWTVCSAYRFLLDSGAELPNTITHLFVYILTHLIEKITPKDKIQYTVLGLGKLALYSATGPHLTFTRDKILSLGLQIELPLGDFLYVDGDPGLDHTIYVWHSDLMREFMLAVHFFISQTSEKVEKTLEMHKKHTHFLDVFMSGLSEPVHRRPLEALLGPFNCVKITEFKKWFRSTCDKSLQGFNKEDHCHCYHLLYQTQNKNTVKEVITSSARLGLSYGNLSLLDYVALNYVVTQLGGMEQLNLYQTSILTKKVAKIMSPAMEVSFTIILSQCSFEDGAVTHLASALSRGQTKKLDLSYSCLSESQFKSLCNGLSNCKLHSLKLMNCKLTEVSCEDLVPALTSATSHLSVLQLLGNKIGDQGLKKICVALRNPHCTIQELELQCGLLTAASMEDLSTALSSGHSKLIKVILSNNEVGDFGVQALCKGLQHPLCKLQSLSLFDCNLTGACCPHLFEALTSKHCPLLELDLSVNELGHEGALLLCRALKRPGSPLEKLSLVRCELTEVVFVELASLLKSGAPPLKSLSVGLNKVGNQGVQHLWEAIRHPSCVLEELDLEMTGLTDACVKDMCAALRASRTLKKLELQNNSLTNASVPALIQVMQDCPSMQEMNVQYNDFGDEMFEMFSLCDKIKY